MKSQTDLFWNSRTLQESDAAKINISDTVQRDHELQFVFRNLNDTMRILEIGCGNGYVTQQLRALVKHVDSFDYSENMIAFARNTFGEQNNRFFEDSVLDPKHVDSDYDAALCVRVLINLRDLKEQMLALRNMSKMLRPGGRLVLIEGFRDGFDFINKTRRTIGLEELVPASINFYSYVHELMPAIVERFEIVQTWHSGMFDFLTRVVYPQLVGAETATGPGDYHAKIEPIIRANTLPDLSEYARLRGFSLMRK